MKFDAWPVDPPGFGMGPLSIRTMSFQPRFARWYAMLLPTMPAPTMTTFALAGNEAMNTAPVGTGAGGATAPAIGACAGLRPAFGIALTKPRSVCHVNAAGTGARVGRA